MTTLILEMFAMTSMSRKINESGLSNGEEWNVQPELFIVLEEDDELSHTSSATPTASLNEEPAVCDECMSLLDSWTLNELTSSEGDAGVESDLGWDDVVFCNNAVDWDVEQEWNVAVQENNASDWDDEVEWVQLLVKCDIDWDYNWKYVVHYNNVVNWINEEEWHNLISGREMSDWNDDVEWANILVYNNVVSVD